MQIDLNRYAEFAKTVCSEPSKNFATFVARLRNLQYGDQQVNVPLLITAGIGLASEGDEFNEIVKKILFQGKPLNEENIFHMKRELGDIAWYWVNACNALGLDPNQVLDENVNKLEARYPGGKFDAYHSENRNLGDL